MTTIPLSYKVITLQIKIIFSNSIVSNAVYTGRELSYHFKQKSIIHKMTLFHNEST